MAANYFNSIRKSYITHLLFTSVLSNLMVFGAPLQQIVFDYYSKKENLISTQGSRIINSPQYTAPDINTIIEEPKDTAETPLTFYALEKQGVIGKASASEVENPIDNIFSIYLPEDFNADKHDAVLVYDLYGLANASQATKSINNYPAYGGKMVVENNNWISVKEEIASVQLKPGNNDIFFNRRANHDYQYKIRNLRIELKEKKKEVIQVTESLTNFNGNVYLSGFVTNPAVTQITVMGQAITVHNGVFEHVLTGMPKNLEALEVFYNPGDNKPRSIKFPVAYQSAEINYQFTEAKYENAEAYMLKDLLSGCITYNALGITIDEADVEKTAGKVIVEGLMFKDVKALDPDLYNVTAGDFTGYRIKKINLADSVSIKLHIKYDPDKIPDGYTAKDVKTFYFDRSQRNWKALPVESLDHENKEIVVITASNETDFINGVIKVPESPETGSFAPTTISDMKYADPTAGEVSIQPPSPSNTGGASTSFPIKLPQGRNGMQPSLSVNYSSEAGNGWMGIGWNLSAPAITLNTKWGAPLFSTSKETEMYSLNGEDLVLNNGSAYGNPNRLDNLNRSAERSFYLRKEGSFQKIIRHGSSPSTYWWEVTDKQGNKSFYGGYAGSMNGVVRDANNNIAHWALVRTQDPYGNYVTYTYDQPTGTLPNTNITVKEFYLSSIEYTLQGSSNPNFYRVEFKRNNYTVPGASTPAARTDVTLNARNGYMQLIDELLSEIHISFVESGQPVKRIRTYRFDYATGPFSKKQLSTIAEYDTNGQLFYSNTCEYYNDIGSSNIIGGTPLNWSGGNDEIHSPLHDITANTGIIPKGSPLGASVSKGFSVGLRIGAGIGYNTTVINTTIGGFGNYSKSNQDTRISFIDINGDGLPDKVYKNSNNVSYRPNTGTAFGSLITITGIDELSTTKSSTIGYGFDANAFGVVGVGDSKSTTKTETDNYFTDFNGDGLPDVASGGMVKFNRSTGTDTNYRDFHSNVNGTENPIVSGAINSSIVPYLKLPSMNHLRGEHPQFDHVKVWQAPYTGTVNISGNASLRASVGDCDGGNNTYQNAFELSIEKPDGSNVTLPSTVLTAVTPTGNNGPSITRTGLEVEKGDLVLFRIHNQNYGCGGEVEWNPVITYTLFNTPGSGITTISDENSKSTGVYNAAQDFILNNDGGLGVTPTGGQVTLKFNLATAGLSSYEFSDDITFKIRRVRITIADGIEQEASWTRTYRHTNGAILDGPGVVGDTQSVSAVNNDTYKDVFYFEVESPSNVIWENIGWKPQITDAMGTHYGGVNYKIYDNNINQRRYWINSNQLVDPVIDPPTEADDDFMTIRHTFFDQSYHTHLNAVPSSYFPLKINWVVKQKVGGVAQTLYSKTFYIHRGNAVIGGWSYTFSKTPPVNDVLTPNVHTDFSRFTFEKQEIKSIYTLGGTIYSAFYVENEVLGNNNLAQVILELVTAEAGNYPTYSTITLQSPFMVASPGKFGYLYRGWGQFLYNGGIKTVVDQEGEVSYDPSVSYGNSDIDMNVFSQVDSQGAADQLNNTDYEQSPSNMGNTEIRYTFYNQQNPNNKYQNTSIKDALYGTNIETGKLTAVIGRFAEPSLHDLFIDESTITGASPGVFIGMKQRSESKGDSFSVSGTLPGIGTTVEKTDSDAKSQVLNMHVDLNGDRYPDIVSGEIQYTNMLGALATPVYPGGFYTGDDSEDTTYGASVAGIKPGSTDTKPTGNKTNTNINAGINQGSGKSFNSKQWADINGDGLPDRVEFSGGVVRVALNKGYEFTEFIDWQYNGGTIDLTSSNRTNGSSSLGGGQSLSYSSSYAFGFGASGSTANMNAMLFDVNGDGLPDLVYNQGFNYKLNTGTSFKGPDGAFFTGTGMEEDRTVSGNVFGSFTGGFAISIFGFPIKITYSPSAGGNASFNEKRGTVQDINGDGLPDVLFKSDDNNNSSLSARLNVVGKTHLLKKVNTPLGGSWTIEYERKGNKYDMPESKWVLTKIQTHDGFEADENFKPNTTLRTITYENPKHDRREREFLGFEKVTIEERDPSNNSLFRSLVTSYHNDNYYLSGLQKETASYNQSGELLSQEKTLYNLLNPDSPLVNLNASEQNHYLQSSLISAADSYLDKSRLFIAVARVTSTIYENGDGLTAIKEFKKYDNYGNIKVYTNYGTGTDDTYTSTVDYYYAIGSLDNAVSYPKKINVTKGSNGFGLLLRQREAEYNSLGKLSLIKTKLNQTESNRVSFAYDSYGNLTTVNQLDNLNSSSNYYVQNISYDAVIKTFPVDFSNTFGESSSMQYNYMFGIPVFTTDMNGQSMRTRIDDRGRIVEVTGPNELALESGTSKWTIRMEYKGEDPITANMEPSQYMLNGKGSFAAVNPGAAQPTASQHYAVTRHFDPEYPSGNQLITISIIDGLGQAIQLKKTHKSDALKWMVSGYEIKDAFGRTLKTYLPAVQDTPTYPTNLNNLTGHLTYFATGTLSDPVEMTYDVKDRVKTVKQPGESQMTEISYLVYEGMFLQRVVNELSQTIDTYTDIRGRQRKTIQNGEITTTFKYNCINELTKVINNENFATEYKYDTAGRKISVSHPDRGVTTFKYNLSGNMIEQSNSNLILNGAQKIQYEYDFNRLVKVTYPENPENEVKFIYGQPGDPYVISQNAVGRLLYQEDATGVQAFGYGRMGEVIHNLRSVAVAGYQSFWFLTRWKYDSWNRVQEIIYPDEEKVIYGYDEAGQIQSIKREIWPLTGLQDIVSNISYNDYGERNSIVYGNGTKTDYAYDMRRRVNYVRHTFSNYHISKKYEFDVLSNILNINTDDASNSLPSAGSIGGPVNHTYEYDNYNRLATATGLFTGSGDISTPYVQQYYTLSMEYNTDHTIKRKRQVHMMGQVNSYGDNVSDARPVQKTSYDINYDGYATATYVAGNYGYRQPHAPTKINEAPSWDGASSQYKKAKEVKYDANGNQLEIIEKKGNDQISLRKNLWDEENRLIGVDLKPDETSDHPIAIYTYNSGGERIVRYNLDHMDVSSNGNEVGEIRNDNIMIYPSGLVMAKPRHIEPSRELQEWNALSYTNHYYIGTERISARIGHVIDLGVYPEDHSSAVMGGIDTALIRNTSNASVEDAEKLVKRVYQKFDVTEPVFSSVVEGSKYTALYNGQPINYYYFHPDHLGSSSYISNLEGVIIQHMEYLPFGETLVDEHTNSYNSPFKFNGKEYDEETGNYYYGARYYDPKWSIFISVDPLVEKTDDSYGYCFNNPIRYTDPTGMEPLDDIYLGRNGKELFRVVNDKPDRTFLVKTSETQESLYSENERKRGDAAKVNNISKDTAKSVEKEIEKGNVDSKLVQDNIVQIENLDVMKEMYNIVKSDDGRGGTSEANNREYGGTKTAGASNVSAVEPGPVANPKTDRNAFITFTIDDTISLIFHSHPSGEIVEGERPGANEIRLGGYSIDTYKFQQAPSVLDINTIGNATGYVFGRGNGMIYVYNSTGVIATMPDKQLKK